MNKTNKTREDTSNLAWLYASMYAPACCIQRLAEFEMSGTGRHRNGGIWQAVIGGRRMLVKIMTLVDMVV